MRSKNKTARRRGKPGGQVREAVVGKRNSTFRSVGPLSVAVKRCRSDVGFSAVAASSGRCGSSAGAGSRPDREGDGRAVRVWGWGGNLYASLLRFERADFD